MENSTMESFDQYRPQVRLARAEDREEFYALWEAGIQAQLGAGRVRARDDARKVLAPLRTPTAAELRRHGRIYYAGIEPSGENILDLEAPLPSAFDDDFRDMDEWHALEGVTTPASVEPLSASPEALLLFRLHQKAAREVLEGAVRSFGRDGAVLTPVRAPTLEETVEHGRLERPGDGGLAAGVALPSVFTAHYDPTRFRVRLTGRGTEDRAGAGAKLTPPDPAGDESAAIEAPTEPAVIEEEEAEEQIA